MRGGSLLAPVRLVLQMIKIEHTVFALPFAFLGAVLAQRGLPSGRTSLLILLAMVGARSAAMAFNRLVDEPFDRENPRTRNRAIPQGLLSRSFVSGFILISSLLFLISAGLLNRLSFILAFPALAIILFYSYSKRFTPFSHLVLGFALSIAPAGGWIAVTGAFSPLIFILSAVVITWVSGFDILYACQDVTFDSSFGLHSIPVRFGVNRAFTLSFAMHGFTILFLLIMYRVFELSWCSLAGIIVLSAILLAEHLIIRPGDLRRIDTAFFTLNGIFSILLFVTVLIDLISLSNPA